MEYRLLSIRMTFFGSFPSKVHYSKEIKHHKDNQILVKSISSISILSMVYIQREISYARVNQPTNTQKFHFQLVFLHFR